MTTQDDSLRRLNTSSWRGFDAEMPAPPSASRPRKRVVLLVPDVLLSATRWSVRNLSATPFLVTGREKSPSVVWGFVVPRPNPRANTSAFCRAAGQWQ